MDRQSVIAMLGWINQIDARIQFNPAAEENWLNAVQTFAPGHVKAAVLEHYRVNETAVTPAGIRRLVLAQRERALAAQAALAAKPLQQDLTYDGILKHSKTAAFRAAFDAGRVEGNAERAYWTAIRECKTHREAQAVAQTVRNEAQVTS